MMRDGGFLRARPHQHTTVPPLFMRAQMPDRLAGECRAPTPVQLPPKSNPSPDVLHFFIYLCDGSLCYISSFLHCFVSHNAL